MAIKKRTGESKPSDDNLFGQGYSYIEIIKYED